MWLWLVYRPACLIIMRSFLLVILSKHSATCGRYAPKDICILSAQVVNLPCSTLVRLRVESSCRLNCTGSGQYFLCPI